MGTKVMTDIVDDFRDIAHKNFQGHFVVIYLEVEN